MSSGSDRREGGGRRAELLTAIADELGRDVSAQTVLFHAAIAERLGISVTEHKAIDVLGRRGPLTAGELAEATGLTTGAVTGMVDRLEAAGFVARAPHPTDRRKVVVEPVADRYREIGSLFLPLGRAVAALLERFGDDELETIHRFVAAIPPLMREEARRLREADDPPS